MSGLMRPYFFILGFVLFPWGHSFAATAYSGSCAPSSTAVTAEQATDFLDAPAALLTRFQAGEGGLASAIRDLITVRPETIEGLQTLAAAASPDQNKAIGAGLGTAASVCVLNQPATAQDIQEAVLKTENNDLIQAFVSITGDITTTAIPGSDPIGDSVPGGGRGSSSPQTPGAVTSSNSVVIGGSSASTTNSVFAVLAASPVPPLSPVSPSN